MADNSALTQQLQDSRKIQGAAEQQVTMLIKSLDLQRASIEKLSSLTKDLNKFKSERKTQDVSALKNHVTVSLILSGLA
jgi:macrodomain Ter protein organizer (MatP/YcbG family)